MLKVLTQKQHRCAQANKLEVLTPKNMEVLTQNSKQVGSAHQKTLEVLMQAKQTGGAHKQKFEVLTQYRLEVHTIKT